MFRTKIVALDAERKKLEKSKHHIGAKAITKREEFTIKLDKLFDIAHKDCVEQILKDSSKDMKAQQEDQRGLRVEIISCRDTKFKARYYKLQKRKEIEEGKKKVRMEKISCINADNDFEHVDLNEEIDEDFVIPGKKIGGPEFIPLLIPKEIGKDIGVILSRFGISSTAAVATLATIINNSRGSIDDFSISLSSLQRQKKQNVNENAQKIKKEFINLAKNKCLTLHFDSKIITETTGQGRKKIERVAVIITCPGIPDAQLIWIVPVDNGKASTQANAIQENLEEWELFDMVEFLLFDTTATNTGWLNGVCTQLEKYRGKAMRWLACRHHMYELYINVSNIIYFCSYLMREANLNLKVLKTALSRLF